MIPESASAPLPATAACAMRPRPGEASRRQLYFSRKINAYEAVFCAIQHSRHHELLLAFGALFKRLADTMTAWSLAHHFHDAWQRDLGAAARP